MPHISHHTLSALTRNPDAARQLRTQHLKTMLRPITSRLSAPMNTAWKYVARATAPLR